MLSPVRATATRAGAPLLAGFCLVAAVGVAAPASAAASSHPVITAVEPSIVAKDGGTVVLVTGRGFTGTESVQLLSPPSATVIGRSASVHFTVESDRTLRLTAPAHAGGPVWIEITTNTGSNSYRDANQLQYTDTQSGTNTPSPAGKDAIGALLLALVLGMVVGRGKDEEDS